MRKTNLSKHNSDLHRYCIILRCKVRRSIILMPKLTTNVEILASASYVIFSAQSPPSNPAWITKDSISCLNSTKKEPLIRGKNIQFNKKMKLKYVELIRLIRRVDSTNKKWISTSAKEESIWTALGVYNSFRSESKNLNYFTASRHHFLNQ